MGLARSRRSTIRAHAKRLRFGSPRRGTRRCPTDLSQHWFVQDVPGASAGEGRPDAASLPKFAKGARAVATEDYRGRLVAPQRTRSEHDAAGRLRALLHRRCARGTVTVCRGRRDLRVDAQLASRRDSREAVPLRAAEVAVARQDATRAEAILRRLIAEDLAAPEDALLALGQVEETLSHREHAIETYRRIYYDSPLSQQAVDAQNGIERLQSTSVISADLVARALRRAQRLFDARRWAQASAGFEAIAKPVDDDNKNLVALRIAECDFYLDRNRIGARRVEAVSEGLALGSRGAATSI